MGFLCFNGFLVNRTGCCGNNVVPAVFLFLLLIIGGAFIIRQIEEPHDKEIITEMRQLYRSFIANYSRNLNETELQKLLQEVFDSLKNGENVDLLWNDSAENRNWSVTESILFIVTILAMIGYGNMTPATIGGKYFVMLLVVCGIPVTLFLLSAFIEKFSSVTNKLLQNLCERDGVVTSKAWFWYLSIFLLLVLILLFFVPSAVIFRLENSWSYLDCFYYCFFSLTTIGFGDYVPGRDWKQSSRDAYIVGISIYLLIGVMFVMTFVSELCRSYCWRNLINTSKDSDEPSMPLNAGNDGEVKGYQSIGDS